MGFVLSKLLWALFTPANLLVWILAAGGVGLWRFWRWALRVSWIGIAVAVVITFLPVGGWGLAWLENRHSYVAPNRVDGIILLGGNEDSELTRLRGQPVLRDAAGRYVEFVRQARAWPKARLVFSGGIGAWPPAEGESAAVVAGKAFEALGLNPARVTLEGRSRNTRENALLAKAAAAPEPGETWLLVTSAAHMPRALAAFQAVGWNVRPAPADYRTSGSFVFFDGPDFLGHMAQVHTALRELAGLVYYMARGWVAPPWA